MSSNSCFLVLRLIGPLQSWGFDSQYSRRNTGLMPTKSAIAGMCCAAFGYDRGGQLEQTFLEKFAAVKTCSIAIPRTIIKKSPTQTKDVVLNVRRLQDYHTVQNTRKADGGTKDCHITHRQYLTDASFGILLEGECDFLQATAEQLKNPVWGIWFGRKSCIPAAPVLAGVKATKVEALKLLGINSLSDYTVQTEMETFAEGRDSIPDSPVSFATEKRLFSPRRVKTVVARV